MNKILIIANILAIGFVASFRAASIGVRLQRVMGRAPAGDLRAEDLGRSGGPYTVGVRVAGIVLSVFALAALWVTIHAAMGPRIPH